MGPIKFTQLLFFRAILPLSVEMLNVAQSNRRVQSLDSGGKVDVRECVLIQRTLHYDDVVLDYGELLERF